MPPIPIHKNDPIAPTAAKPDGTTTQTANPPPTRTTPASIPATTTTDPSIPPPPQPGARPIPPTATAPTTSNDNPAPPQPGPTATHITTETRLSGPPPQFSIPPPSDSQLAGRSTTTTNPPTTSTTHPGPTTLNYGPAASPFQTEHSSSQVPVQTDNPTARRSLENPPGYQQNASSSAYIPPKQMEQGGAENGGVGEAAWNMLSRAGEALKKGEEAAWKAVRNK